MGMDGEETMLFDDQTAEHTAEHTKEGREEGRE